MVSKKSRMQNLPKRRNVLSAESSMHWIGRVMNESVMVFRSWNSSMSQMWICWSSDAAIQKQKSLLRKNKPRD